MSIGGLTAKVCWLGLRVGSRLAAGAQSAFIEMNQLNSCNGLAKMTAL